VYLYNYKKDDIAEMFHRLQEGSSLNAAEKRRSIPGNVHPIISKLCNHPIFSTTDFLKFKDVRAAFEDRCAKIFHQFYHKNICSISPKEIKKSYLKNKNLNGDDQVIKDIKSAFNFLHQSLKDKTPLLRKWAILRLTYLIHELRSQYNLNDFIKDFGDAYKDFDLLRNLDKQKPIEDQDPQLVEFSNCARGDSLAGQLFIHEYLKKEILKRIPDLKLKDGHSCFSDSQREIIFQESKGKCQADKSASWYDAQKCQKAIIFHENFHADHIEPYSRGGATSIENGQALCSTCNLKKSNS